LSDYDVSSAKLGGYLLNAEHPIGRAKARFFLALGFGEDGSALRTALADHPRRNAVESAVETRFGRKLVVRCRIVSPDGRDPCIVTVWIEEPGEAARLVTAYPA
jgi:hypothetical protein